MGDREGEPVQLDGVGRGEPAVAQLGEKHQQPPVASEASGRVPWLCGGKRISEPSPGSDESQPGAVDDLPELLARGEVIRTGC